MPKALKGTIAGLVLYVIIYVIATFNPQAELTLPAGLMYLLFAYAIIGCLGMVLVLPLSILKKK